MIAEVLAGLFLGLTCYSGALTVRPLKGLSPGIVSLEVTCRVENANAILSAWQRQKPHQWKELLLESLRRDTFFILSYAPLLGVLCWISAEHLHPFWPKLSCSVIILGFAQVLTAICDFIENYGLRRTIFAEAGSAPWVQITGTASIVKWFLIAFGILIPAITFGHYVIHILKR